MCDEDLLVRVASGDERAFETLYGRHAAAVRAFVRVRVPDAGTAEEVCADVWLGCWRSARAFRGDAKVLSWLLGIAKRQIYMRVRRVRPNVTALDDAPEPRDDGPSPETAVLSEAGVDDLMRCCAGCPSNWWRRPRWRGCTACRTGRSPICRTCRKARSNPVSRVRAVCCARNSTAKTMRMERNGES